MGLLVQNTKVRLIYWGCWPLSIGYWHTFFCIYMYMYVYETLCDNI